jgi:hypothetical protein
MVDSKDSKERKERNRYGDVELREVFLFDQSREVYTHVRREIRGGVLTAEVVYRLIRLEFGVGQPSMILLVLGAEFDPRRRGYVAQPLDEENYAYLEREESIPSPRARGIFEDVLSEHGISKFGDVKVSGLDVAPLWRGLLKWNRAITEGAGGGPPVIFKAAPAVSDEELEKVLGWDWEGYVHDLLYMGAEKDGRIALVGKAHMVPQFPEMRMKNSISLIITNPGTGKSVLLSRVGFIVSRTTARSITGGARVDGTVVPSFLMGLRRLVVVEHLEAKPEEGLLAYLLTTISGIPSRIVIWQTEQEFSPYCAAAVTGNPNRERGQPNFQAFFVYLQGVTDNYLALGRRVSMILFGMDYAVVESETDVDGLPWVAPAWRIWWEIADRIDPLVRTVYQHPETQAWLNEPDEEYSAAVETVYGSAEPSEVRDFWLEHGRNAHPTIKWRALCCALVDRGQELLRRALHGLGVDRDIGEAILEGARAAYREIKTVNLRSLQEIQETAELEEEILQMVFEGLPRYLRELLVTVGHYATRDGAQLAFPVETLTPTFDEIKGALGLYSGFSRIVQMFQPGQTALKYGSKLDQFGVALEETQGLWLVRLTDLHNLGRFVTLLTPLTLLMVGYKPTLSPALTEEWGRVSARREVEREVGRGRLQEAIDRGLTWISDQRNLDEDGWADLEELQRVVGDRRVVGLMIRDKMIWMHPTKRGKVKRT